MRLKSIFLSLVLVTALCRPAGAVKVSIQGRLRLGIAWTDNILSVPLTPTAVPPTSVAVVPQSDGYLEVVPSLILTLAQPRVVQSLTYTLTGDVYFQHSEADSYLNHLEYNGFYTPSNRAEVTLTVSGSEGRLNAFSPSQLSDLGPVLQLRPGSLTYGAAALREILLYELSQRWRLNQSLGFNAFIPIDSGQLSTTLAADQQLGADFVQRKNAFGFALRVGYLAYLELRDITGTVLSPTRQQLLNSLIGRWRRDYGTQFATELAFGVVESNRAQGGGVTLWEPYALAAGRWFGERGLVELSYTHNVGPSALTAQTYVADQVFLRVNVLLVKRSPLVASGAVGYQYGRVADVEQGQDLGRNHLVTLDANLTWNPHPSVGVFARYTFFDQIGFSGDPVVLPETRKQIVMLGVIATYPATAAAKVPSRQSLRVDRSDGETIPEAHTPTQEN